MHLRNELYILASLPINRVSDEKTLWYSSEKHYPARFE